jgi:hypothetical protein
MRIAWIIEGADVMNRTVSTYLHPSEEDVVRLDLRLMVRMRGCWGFYRYLEGREIAEPFPRKRASNCRS